MADGVYDEWRNRISHSRDIFVAFFYSGLGCALALAGVLFAKNYLCYDRLFEEE